LVLNPGIAHRREKLAGLLWPDATDANARGYLRKALWQLRKTLPPGDTPGSDYWLVDEIALGFNAETEYWLDAAELEREPAGADVLEADRQAAAAYRGELLPGFYDEWVVLERERLAARFEQRIGRLLDGLTAAQAWPAVLEWGERWIALGGTPEPAFRGLMMAHSRLGNPSAVAADYQRCVEVLARDLGVEPAEPTKSLYSRLVAGGPVREVPSGTVTFLFTDIAGSTRLLEMLGSQYAQVLDDQRTIVRSALAAHGGHEVDTSGDAFFIAFRRALDALNCAVDVQRALAGHPWPRGAQVQLRMGLHTGEPLVARTGYVGLDVHRAARIGAAGHGGQVLLSQTTRDLTYQDLPAGTALRALGDYQLKDIRHPQAVFQLDIEGLPAEFPALKSLRALEASAALDDTPPAPGESPFKGLQRFEPADSSRFFGREHLTDTFVERLGQHPFLAIVGASGSGKSSLVRAGLVPALSAGAAGSVFLLTPGAHPLASVAACLVESAYDTAAVARLTQELEQDPGTLLRHLRRSAARDGANGAPRPIFVADQFEELFTLCRSEAEQQAFVDNLLLAALAPDAPARVVIALRADFYAHCAQYPELRAALAGASIARRSSEALIGPI
jgi:class 3 adenylate cyclase